MLNKMKNIIIRLHNRFKKVTPTVEYIGDFDSFEKAKNECEGYGAQTIFDKVSKSTLAVIDGKAKYERDGYLFYDKACNYNLMMYLYCLMIKDGFVSVLDWGGAMGSTFFQHRQMLQSVFCKWHVVEQPHYVNFARENISVDSISFYESMSQIKDKCNCILFSSVLQYIDNPAEVAKEAVERAPRYIIIERTPVSTCHHIWIQKVHEPIYEASYAACVYTKEEIVNMFCSDERYMLVDEWHSLVDGDERMGKNVVCYKSFVFEKI